MLLHAGDAAAPKALAALKPGERAGNATRAALATREAQELDCMLTWQVGDPAAAKKKCLEVLRDTDSSAVLRTVAEIALTAGDGLISTRSIEGALAHEHRDPEIWFLAAAAQDVGHHELESRRALEAALRVDPSFVPALRSELALDTSAPQRLAALKTWRAGAYADGLLRSADAYAALGLTARSEACLAALERRDAERGKWARLLVRSRSKPAALATELTALLAQGPAKSALGLTTAASIFLSNSEPARALPLALQALQLDPTDLEAEDLVVQAGGHPAKPLPRFAPFPERPTNRWIDALIPLPPLIHRVVVTPYGAQPIPEAQGLLDLERRAFPQIEWVLDETRPVPPAALSGTRASAEALLAALPDEPGRMAIVTNDLVTSAGTFGYGALDVASARGVASVNRFRSRAGQPTDPWATPSDEDVTRARLRLVEEVTATLGKLLGLSHPCLQARCALRAPSNVEEFDANGPDLCASHQQELARLYEVAPTGADAGAAQTSSAAKRPEASTASTPAPGKAPAPAR